MNKFKFYFIALISLLTFFSCQKDDTPITTIPLKDYKVQYGDEIKLIDNYLDTHYIFDVDTDLNISFAPLIKTGKIFASTNSDIIEGKETIFTKEFTEGDDIYTKDGDTKIGTILEINSDTKITLTTVSSISAPTDATIKCRVNKPTIRNQTQYKLEDKLVNLHDQNYTLYYLVLRQGGVYDPITKRGGFSPCNTDAVLAAYSGSYLKSTTENNETTVSATFFEEAKLPSGFLNLFPNALGQGLIRGWSEIMPEFKTGSYTKNPMNGKITYTDFGAGVMFLPSAFAYYNSGAGTIPSYSPLIFSFKLYEISRVDSDGDGLYNYQEDRNGDNYMYSYTNTTNYPIPPKNEDDTDDDKIPNFLDIDDDGDNFSTKFEISKGSNYLDKFDIPK